MAMARFLQLCMDVHGDDTLGRFWATTIGSGFEPRAGDLGDVVGELPHQSIAMCPVPEAKTVKHRVHLDVDAGSLDELVARGARVLLPHTESGFGWTVMADPEGGEFCAFLRDQPPAFRLHGIAVDCVDARASAAWWGEVFGVEPVREDGTTWWTLEHATPDAVLTFDFSSVPEPKTVKNRIHWDVEGPPGTVAALEAHGAVRLWQMPGWTTLADPEGNEFCVFERAVSPG